MEEVILMLSNAELARPIMGYVRELEERVRDLKQENTTVKRAMVYVIATKAPLAMGLGVIGGMLTAGLVWMIWR